MLEQIQRLVAAGQVQISRHGLREIEADALLVSELLEGIRAANVVEEYPDYHKGPCVLVLQQVGRADPVHVLWGIPKHSMEPAVLITAYRPDAARWSADFLRRLK